MDKYELLLGGEWEKSHGGKYETAINPSNGNAVALYASADKTDTNKAVDLAREAFERGDWSQLSIGKRAAVLKKATKIMKERSEDLAQLEMAKKKSSRIVVSALELAAVRIQRAFPALGSREDNCRERKS